MIVAQKANYYYYTSLYSTENNFAPSSIATCIMTAIARKTVPCCVMMSWQKGCFRISQNLNLPFKVSCLLRTLLCIVQLSGELIRVQGHFTFPGALPMYPSSATTCSRGSRWWIRVCQKLLCLWTYPQEKDLQATLNSRQLCPPQARSGAHIFLWICARKMGSLLQLDLAGGCCSRCRQCWWGSCWHCHSFSCSQKQSRTKKWIVWLVGCNFLPKSIHKRLTTSEVSSAIASINGQMNFRRVLGSIAPAKPPTTAHVMLCFGYALMK